VAIHGMFLRFSLLQLELEFLAPQAQASSTLPKNPPVHRHIPTEEMPPRFGQLIIGPPGSGKSTYCDGMHQFLSAVGRPCSVVNLDPANDATSYKAALDVRSLVGLEEIMNDEELGPNGGVLHALEALEQDFDWLADGLEELGGL
jgi:GTPase SAR1 family protein